MFFLFANKKKFWVSYPPTSIQSRCLPYTSRYSDTRRCSILNCFYNRFKWYTDVNPNDIKPKEINANYCIFTRRRQKAEWHNHKIALFLHEKLCTEFENQFAERLNQSGVLSWTALIQTRVLSWTALIQSGVLSWTALIQSRVLSWTALIQRGVLS